MGKIERMGMTTLWDHPLPNSLHSTSIWLVPLAISSPSLYGSTFPLGLQEMNEGFIDTMQAVLVNSKQKVVWGISLYNKVISIKKF